jgi:signal transduction histidine kinase
MQAHPLSSPAARRPSTPSPVSVPTPSHAQPRTRVQLSGKSSSKLSRKPAPLSESPTPTLANTIDLAHDAGNLLGALALYCDLLSAPGILRPEHRHYATELSTISDRSSELIRRLLALPSATTPISSQPDNAAPQPPSPIRTSARNHASMLHSVAPVLQGIAAGAATVSVTCPTSLPPLDFPAEIIERIMVNLVRNAAEAIRSERSNTHNARSNTHNARGNNARSKTPAAAFAVRGEIHVTLAILSGHLQLTVEDNGPGMPPAIAAAFLQPSPLPPGATRGLGHRIIHALATASEGQLSVRVRHGKGTAFCLKWPVPSQRPAAPGLSTSSRKTA